MKTKKVLGGLLLGLQMVAVTLGATLCWLVGGMGIDVSHLDGKTYGSYFYRGTGTEQDPFTITRPIHLYNLAKLVNLDSTNGTSFGNMYYQLGYDLDEDGDVEFFNYDDDGNNLGTYSDTLNMNYIDNLEPIGNLDSPFSGVINGNNLTLKNLKINCTGKADGGLFGVTLTDADISNMYIDTIDIDVTNMIIDNSETTDIDRNTDCAFVGYLAGSVESAASFTNVYINKCKLSGQSNVARIENDWGYFGYCRDATSLQDFISKATGGTGESQFGASIDMNAMYTRLRSMNSSATAVNNATYEQNIITKRDGTTYTANGIVGLKRTYSTNDNKAGHVVFSTANTNNSGSNNYLYLTGGGTTATGTQVSSSNYTGYKIQGNNSGTINYLSVDITGQYLRNETDSSKATNWRVGGSGKNRQFYVTVDGTNHYLTATVLNSAAYLTTTTTSSTWSLGSNLQTGNNKSNTLSMTVTLNNRSTTEYLRFTNSAWGLNTSSGNVYTTSTSNVNYNYSVTSTSSPDYSQNNNTYFPLLTESDIGVSNSYNAAENNTGYVVSGCDDRTTSTVFPDKSGDIRVSQYSTGDISASWNSTTKTLSTVYTVDLDQNGNLRRRTLTDNEDFEKYTESKAGLVNSFQTSGTRTNIYGLHFMDAEISLNSLVTASYALINRDTYSNYQLPANCIDVNLPIKGVVNFFAGTYFANNNSFFSLHEIFRNKDTQAITGIKEISQIYDSGNRRDPYIYKYSDGTYSTEDNTLPSGYTLKFDTRAIKNQSNLGSSNNIVNNAVYYFEIPMNKGEYALGSVSGGTGAYLIYLDIASSGMQDAIKTVNSFGSVEYRNKPETVTDSVCLLTFILEQNNPIEIYCEYVGVNPSDPEGKLRYNVGVDAVAGQTIKVTLLSDLYEILVTNIATTTTYSNVNTVRTAELML